jgi:hypothetical protein
MHLFALKAKKLSHLSQKESHIFMQAAQSPLYPFSANSIIVAD